MPDPDKEKEIFEQWKQSNGQHWIENFRAAMIYPTDIEHNWQFSNRQSDILKQYIEANKLLIDCLNSDCYVSIKVRNELENRLLLLPSELTQLAQRSPSIDNGVPTAPG